MKIQAYNMHPLKSVKFICLIFLLLETISFQNVSNLKIDTESCHLRELELCTVGVASFFQNPNGIPVHDAELERQCEYLDESMDCFNEYTDRCMTSIQSLAINMFSNDLHSIGREFCTNGTELRTIYKKNAPCLRNIQRKYQRDCMNDLQAGFESIHKLNTTSRLATSCCNINRLRECILPKVEEECGQESIELVDKLMIRAIGSTFNVFCRNYDPSAKQCEALLPKKGTKPNTGRNTSVISRIISSYVHTRVR